MNLLPVRCYTCNAVISQLQYERRLRECLLCEDTPSIKKILDEMGVNRYCCRKVYMGHVYSITRDEVIHFKTLKEIWNENSGDEEFVKKYKEAVKNDGKAFKLKMRKMEQAHPDFEFTLIRVDGLRQIISKRKDGASRDTPYPPVLTFKPKSEFDYFFERSQLEVAHVSEEVIVAQEMIKL
jgi:DNA-directed RNA polymerase subunit N (RpoN/RPB10)